MQKEQTYKAGHLIRAEPSHIDRDEETRILSPVCDSVLKSSREPDINSNSLEQPHHLPEFSKVSSV